MNEEEMTNQQDYSVADEENGQQNHGGTATSDQETLTDDPNNPDNQDVRLPEDQVGDEDTAEINDQAAWDEREDEIEAAGE